MPRVEWAARARAARWDVHDAVMRHTTYLVASRTDTDKARAAARLGVVPITYREFLGLLLGGNLADMRGRQRVVVDPTIVQPPGHDRYEVGFWRGEFTAMHGDVCLERHHIPDYAVMAIRVHATRAGVEPLITWTSKATKQRNALVAARSTTPAVRLVPASPPPHPDEAQYGHRVFATDNGRWMVQGWGEAFDTRHEALDFYAAERMFMTVTNFSGRPNPEPEPPRGPQPHPLGGGMRRIINLDGD